MKTILVTTLFALMLWSCGDNKAHDKPDNNSSPIEVSLIYPQDSIAFVLEGYEDTILTSAYFHIKEDKWYFSADGSQDQTNSIPINIKPLSSFSSSAVLETWNWLNDGKPQKVLEGFTYEYIPNDTIRYVVPYKLWWKAECNRAMPGFASPCLRTFGKHKAFGSSMRWSVNKHTVCGPGKSFCLEQKRNVGTIQYHQSIDCSDSLFRVVPIDKFVCN